MDYTQSIQWFPGHMAKTRRQIKESLKSVDIVAEIIDSRIPISSRNPEILSLIADKPHIIVVNKTDMSNQNQTDKWIKYYESIGAYAVKVDCASGKGLKSFPLCVRKVLRDKIERWNKRGIEGRTIRVMAVGIPNVGKSSFINRISSSRRAKAEDRPGVTRSSQWFSVGDSMEILDTPGVLWPKFEDKKVGINLAFTGAVKDDIIDIYELSLNLLELLKENYISELCKRYKLDTESAKEMNTVELIKAIGVKRGMLLQGGEIDLHRVSAMLVDEFRSAKIGKITLEAVD